MKTRTLYYEVVYMRWLNDGRKVYLTETYATELSMRINRWLCTHLDGLRHISTKRIVG